MASSSAYCRASAGCLSRAAVPRASNRCPLATGSRRQPTPSPEPFLFRESLRPRPRRRWISCRSAEALMPLGEDFLKFLAAFVVITPLFKRINVSPILGFLLAGVLLRQANAISSPKELSDLAELGVLFLLFEMGLELSTDRLTALSTYAFGMGTAQVVGSAAVFVAFAYPFGASMGTWLLEHLAYADAQIASITSWEEAVVIAVALSLSSSAFVLQLLGEKGQLASRSGSATLGILLFQDLVTVPFLVLVPLLAPAVTTAIPDTIAAVSSPVTAALPDGSVDAATYLAAAAETATNPTAATLAKEFLPTVARSLGLLGGIILFGRLALRRVFSAVAATGSPDAFVAACLLTVCGTAMATDSAGFGQTLGAFLAGVLLAESSFRPQVEAEIKPFKGVLLGLFFLCTGASVDVSVLLSRFPIIALLTVGLLSVKFAITSLSARAFGLSEGESVKVGLTLSQGGEFAFVLLALAQELRLLPGELNALLICVVVASMALTPLLADIGAWYEERESKALIAQEASSLAYELMDPEAPQCMVDQNATTITTATSQPLEASPVVLLGFNEASQVVANMLASPLTGRPAPWIAFSFNPDAVREARGKGLPVLFGDGSNMSVYKAATPQQPRSFVLTLRSHPQLMNALRNIKQSWPGVPVFALCIDVNRAAEAMRAGATSAVVTRASAGVALGDALLRNLMDTSYVDLVFLEQEMQLMVKDAVSAKGRENSEHEAEQQEAGDGGARAPVLGGIPVRRVVGRVGGAAEVKADELETPLQAGGPANGSGEAAVSNGNGSENDGSGSGSDSAGPLAPGQKIDRHGQWARTAAKLKMKATEASKSPHPVSIGSGSGSYDRGSSLDEGDKALD